MKIVVLEKLPFNEEQRNILESFGEVEYYEGPKNYVDLVKDADLVVLDWLDPNPLLDKMKENSQISLMSTGYSWVDLKKASEKGIKVTNIPAYATEAVAEHIFGLILSLTKGITYGDRCHRKDSKVDFTGIELKGKTLGVVGCGRIGLRVAEIGKGFGMRVIGYDPVQDNEFEYVVLDELLKKSDIVAVTCLRNDSSINLLTKEKLELMKKDSILVGTTWLIVDLKALADLYEQGNFFGIGFDVEIQSNENGVPESLKNKDNVIFTPHIAYKTDQSDINRINVLLENIKGYIDGKKINVVN